MDTTPDWWYDDEPEPEPDEFEEAAMDCHMFADGGFWSCGAVGSEHCDFECPFRCDLGKRVECERDPYAGSSQD